MSTSSSQGSAASKLELQPFPYADVANSQLGISDLTALFGKVTAEDLSQTAQAAHEAGRREGEAQAQAHLEAELTRTREAVAETLAAFANEREAFYRKIEPEIVKLALSIAKKVLHREAQVDPLLLAGMVRVAVEGIEAGTRVTVRANPRLIESWSKYLKQHLAPEKMPELVEDAALQESHCLVQTEVGKTELGWEIQLKEIESGLLDLLGEFPQRSV
jgi:flagellar assembly protein FliH